MSTICCSLSLSEQLAEILVQHEEVKSFLSNYCPPQLEEFVWFEESKPAQEIRDWNILDMETEKIINQKHSEEWRLVVKMDSTNSKNDEI